jgi:hypothetical protein
MLLWTTPLPLEQLFNKSDASGDGNCFTPLAGTAPENPDQAVPPGGLLGLFLGGPR